jgi:copper chaperone CopZ
MSLYVRVITVAFVVLVAALAVQAGGRADTVRTVFTVEGMHCDGCSSTITATLKRHEGVLEASADHELGTAQAVYHPRQVKAEELKAEIEKLGYTVTGMSTEAVDS